MRKVALVTGSTRGIGLNIVQKLAENNYNVIITGKSTNDPVRGDIYKAEELIKKKYNVDTLAIPLDIRNLSLACLQMDEGAGSGGRLRSTANMAVGLPSSHEVSNHDATVLCSTMYDQIVTPEYIWQSVLLLTRTVPEGTLQYSPKLSLVRPLLRLQHHPYKHQRPNCDRRDFHRNTV